MEAWRAALGELSASRRELLLALPLVVAVLVVMNLPWLPAYERGLLTGAFLVMILWILAWRVWVTSGLSLRLNGVWAEQEIAHRLSASRSVYSIIPSFNLDRVDIDAVAITRASVLAVEVKWRLAEVDGDYLDDVAFDAALRCRTLRHHLKIEGLSPELVNPLVVICGPKGRRLEVQRRPVQAGSIEWVDVMGSAALDEWLGRTTRGPIAPDFAERILNELEPIARHRDKLGQDGWLLRRLARVR